MTTSEVCPPKYSSDKAARLIKIVEASDWTSDEVHPLNYSYIVDLLFTMLFPSSPSRLFILYTMDMLFCPLANME